MMKAVTGKLVLLVLILSLLPVVTYSATSISSSEQEDNDGEVNAYPEGWIDWIQENTIVIGDTQYLRTGVTRYYDKNLQQVGFSHFSVNMYVQFEVDPDYRLIVVYEKEKNESDVPVSERRFKNKEGRETKIKDSTTSGSDVYREGGVWKN